MRLTYYFTIIYATELFTFQPVSAMTLKHKTIQTSFSVCLFHMKNHNHCFGWLHLLMNKSFVTGSYRLPIDVCYLNQGITESPMREALKPTYP